MSSKLNRRTILAGAAAATLPTPALSAIEPDPVFAAIEAHRRADTVFYAATTDEELNATCDGEAAAARALFRTIPTTLAGVAAVVSYVVRLEQAGREMMNLSMEDHSGLEDGGVTFLQTLDAALTALASRGGRS